MNIKTMKLKKIFFSGFTSNSHGKSDFINVVNNVFNQKYLKYVLSSLEIVKYHLIIFDTTIYI